MLRTATATTSTLALLFLSPRPAFASSCKGPRIPGELRKALWGPDSGYDKYTRPTVARFAANETTNPADAPPDLARVQLHILSLSSVDQKRNEYEINVEFRQRWNDYRLKYSTAKDGGCFSDVRGHEGFPTSSLDELWKPDIFFENKVMEGDGNAVDSLWVHPDGDVDYTKSLLVTLACDMNFESYPFDVQICGIRVGTFLEDATDVKLGFWTDREPVTRLPEKYDETVHAQGGSNIWHLTSAKGVIAEERSDHDPAQMESYVYYIFELDRDSEYYYDFVILPAILMVIISWGSFFICRTAAPARVAMSMICFLSNTNFLSTQISDLPRINNNDCWLLQLLTISQLFTFYGVMEYVVCNYLCRVERRIIGGQKRARDYKVAKLRNHLHTRSSSSSSGSQDRKDDVFEENYDVEKALCSITKDDIKAAGFKYRFDLLMLNENGEMHFKDQHIDFFSRLVYPVAYAIACAVMWLRI